MAQAIIDSANILLPTGSLSDAYDELGTRYAIPNFCISVPANIEGGAAAAAASLVASADEAVRKSAAPVAVRVRLSTMKDLTIEMLDCDTVLACVVCPRVEYDTDDHVFYCIFCVKMCVIMYEYDVLCV